MREITVEVEGQRRLNNAQTEPSSLCLCYKCSSEPMLTVVSFLWVFFSALVSLLSLGSLLVILQPGLAGQQREPGAAADTCAARTREVFVASPPPHTHTKKRPLQWGSREPWLSSVVTSQQVWLCVCVCVSQGHYTHFDLCHPVEISTTVLFLPPFFSFQ